MNEGHKVREGGSKEKKKRKKKKKKKKERKKERKKKREKSTQSVGGCLGSSRGVSVAAYAYACADVDSSTFGTRQAKNHMLFTEKLVKKRDGLNGHIRDI